MTKIMVTTVIAAVVWVIAAAPLSARAEPMMNDDVIRLVKAGMTEALILATIDASEPKFDTSSDAIKKLKEARVDDAIIHRMVEKKKGAITTAAVAKGGDCRLSAFEDLQPVMDGATQVNLGYHEAHIDEDVTGLSTVAGFLTRGVAPGKGTVLARISGDRATNRIRSKVPVFLDLGALEGQSTEDAFALVRLEVKDNDRLLVIGESSASLSGDHKGGAKLKEGNTLPLDLEILQSNCSLRDQMMNMYRGTPATPLSPGEYALVYGDRFFDFGIDP